MEKAGLATTLQGLGIDLEGEKNIISKRFNPHRVANNPRVVTKEVLCLILEGIRK